MRLAEHECYRRIKAIDIGPALSVIDRLRWHDTGGKCAHVASLDQRFPKQLPDLVRSLALGGVTQRWFLRKLVAKQGIAPHVDDWIPAEKDWRRFQVPLVSHPDVLMRWPDDGVEVHLEPGFLYEVRFDRLHEVVNPTDCARIHMQIDQVNATI